MTSFSSPSTPASPLDNSTARPLDHSTFRLLNPTTRQLGGGSTPLRQTPNWSPLSLDLPSRRHSPCLGRRQATVPLGNHIPLSTFPLRRHSPSLRTPGEAATDKVPSQQALDDLSPLVSSLTLPPSFAVSTFGQYVGGSVVSTLWREVRVQSEATGRWPSLAWWLRPLCGRQAPVKSARSTVRGVRLLPLGKLGRV